MVTSNIEDFMADENPLEQMLNELADLFKMVEENKTKPLEEIMTPEIKAHLEDLKAVIGKFSDLNSQVFNSAGVSDEDLKKIINNPPPTTPPKIKKILEYSKKLKRDVDAAKLQLTGNSPKDPSPFSKEKQKPADIAKRKKKFKRMGGNWI